MAVPGADDAPAWPPDAVEVGRVIDAWGIKGGFKVLPLSTDPQALFSSRHWFLQTAGGARLLKIKGAREHGEFIVATAHEVDDRNAAETLKGARVFVSRGSFPSAGEGEYYWVDLIGLSVVNRQGETLGTVEDLLDTGAHSVLRVRDGEVERLIPFVAAYVDDVDLAQKRIQVDWGLDY